MGTDPDSSSLRLVRFGPFELNCVTGELRKHGVRIRLQEQPFRLLLCLIEGRGAVISREDLIRRIWPEGTFVDYDHGLNAAVTRIRQALRDSADHPRYIETAARKGYRFIATVEQVELPAVQSARPHALAETPKPLPQPDRPVAHSRMAPWALGAIVAGILALGATVWVRWQQPASGTMLLQLTEDAGLTMDPAVSPDGKLLAYVSDRGGGRLNVWVQQLVPGGTSVQLTHDKVDLREPSFSPDGSKIVYHRDNTTGGIYVVPAIGGPAVQIVPSGRSARFSPDGKWISYWAGATLTSFPDGGAWGRVFIVPALGGQSKPVGADLQAAAYPLWSPDSQSLLVYVNADLSLPARNHDWWIIPLDGAASRRTGAFARLEQQGIRISDGHVPRAYDWALEGISFSATLGDARNAWRVSGPTQDRQITGPARRLTSGTTLEVSPVSTRDRLFFASVHRAFGIWALDRDVQTGAVTGAPKRLTNGGAELMPSISEDGRVLVFSSSRTKDTDIWLQDLTTGQHRPLVNTTGAEWRPRITRDGSTVAYVVWQPPNDEIRTVPVSGGASKRVTAGSGFVWWMTAQQLLYNKRLSHPGILSLDLSSGKERVLVQKAGERLFQASYSPDEKWMVIEAVPPDSLLSRVFVLPVRDGTPASEREWIQIGRDGGWHDKPRWAPDGNSIYFISHEDGFRCLWHQRLNPTTKQPTGPPSGIYHFHDTRLSMLNVGIGLLEIDVAKDKIVFGLGELTGNIWSLGPSGQGS